MNTKLLMTATSIVLGLTGIVLSFLPKEVLIFIHEQPSPILTLMVQLMGALYFAFAILNWMAKDSLLGGIYGRYVVVANTTHCVIAAVTLIKSATANNTMIIWTAALVYSVFAILFSVLMYTNPSKKEP